jgi:hypothetical protein
MRIRLLQVLTNDREQMAGFFHSQLMLMFSALDEALKKLYETHWNKKVVSFELNPDFMHTSTNLPISNTELFGSFRRFRKLNACNGGAEEKIYYRHEIWTIQEYPQFRNNSSR